MKASTLTALYVTAEACIKAHFADNSLLVLNNDGTAFLHVDPQGNRTQQLCHYALSRYHAKLACVLQFRNQHMACQPVWCPVLEQGSQGFEAGYVISSVTWPGSVMAAIAAGLLRRAPCEQERQPVRASQCSGLSCCSNLQPITATVSSPGRR